MGAQGRLNSALAVIAIILIFMCNVTPEDSFAVAAGEETDVLKEEESSPYQDKRVINTHDNRQEADITEVEVIKSENVADESRTDEVLTGDDPSDTTEKKEDASEDEKAVSDETVNTEKSTDFTDAADGSNISAESIIEEITGGEGSVIDGTELYRHLLGSIADTDGASVPLIARLPVEDNNARYQYITGADYCAYTVGNMPEGYRNDKEAARNMVTVKLPVWKINEMGAKYPSAYTIRIHNRLLVSVVFIFNEIYALDIKFPVKYMTGYGYRKVGGVGLVNSELMSAHSFGTAIDINPDNFDNDYFLGYGNDLRNRTNPYCIPDEVIDIFRKYGWNWGGDFDICSDTMHFQYLGLEFLQYGDNDIFPVLMKGAKNEYIYVENLQQRLVELGYMKKIYRTFNSTVQEAVIRFQQDNGLTDDGIVEYGTWETIINRTHYMNYVF